MALTFPSSPVDGQLYVDSVTGNRYIYDSGNGLWKYASNNVSMTVGTAPPPSTAVAPGAMWYNTNTGRTFILYDDGDSRQWVENVPAVGSFDSSTVAGYANAAVLPAVTPAYNTANAAFAKANTALANTSGVWFGGDLSVSGTFGVGTSTAYGKFNVVGGRSFQIANNEIYALGLGYHSSTGGYYYLGASNSSTPDLIFSQVGGSERMRLTNSGSLGIGTTSPNYKLHLADGNMAITSSTGAGTFQITDDSDSGRGLLLKSNHLGSGNTYVGTNSSIKNLIFGIDQNERMRIDTGNRVYKTSHAAMMGFMSWSGSITRSTSVIPFNSINQGGTDFNTSTYRFTAPVTGMYHFDATVRTGGGGGADFVIYLCVNGSNFVDSWAYDAAGKNYGAQVSAVRALSAGDYVTVQWTHDSGTATLTAAWFSYFII